MCSIDIRVEIAKLSDEAVESIFDDLALVLSFYIYRMNTWEVRQQMRKDILLYFASAWPEIVLHRVVVDTLSHGGDIDVIVSGEATDDIEEVVNYEVDYYIDFNEETSDIVEDPQEAKPESIDDILYSSIDRSKIQE